MKKLLLLLMLLVTVPCVRAAQLGVQYDTVTRRMNPTNLVIDLRPAPGGTTYPILHAGTNAENGLTVSTNGRIGIGIALPEHSLDINGGLAKVRTGSGGWYIYSLANGFRAAFADTGTRTDIFGDGTETSPYMSLNDGGVGIGTSFPLAALSISNATAATPLLRIFASNNPTPVLTVASNGNVGVGTASPGGELEIGAATGTVHSDLILSAGNSGTGTANIKVGSKTREWQVMANAFPYPWQLNYIGTDAPLTNIITALPSGNVGIGTNAPASPLHVRPILGGQSYLRVDDTNGTARFQVGSLPVSPQFGAIYLGDVTPSGLNYAIISDGGTVQLNATALLSLTINGSVRWNVNSSGHFLANADNTYDIGAIGATRPRALYVAGAGTFGGTLSGDSFMVSTVGNGFTFASRGFLIPSGDGIITLLNANADNFNRLALGGSTAAFPAIGRTNGDLVVFGGNGAFGGGATNRLLLHGGLVVGPPGTAGTLTNTLYASATLDFPSTVAGTVSDLNITVAGAADGDVVALGEPSGSIGPLTGVFNAWASNGVVFVRFANNNLVTAQDPASGTFKVRVDKFK